ncbi:MAG: fumarylacetoacetate hydrolase family protein [Myxococcales bacterium]|nr:fumarylacetoacetate hydrolase family protein [Myxococcales bacterium]
MKDGAGYVLDGAPWEGAGQTGEVLAQVDAAGRAAGWVRLPPATPSKIVCVGRNYRAHAAELGHEVPPEPLLFLKPPSSVVGPDDAVEIPPDRISSRVEHEVELALVIGRRTRRASLAEASAAVFGYTAACDVTARDLQKKDGQWTRAKGMDTFCPLGPVLVAGLDTSALALGCTVSGVVRQDGTTADMVFRPAELVAYASAVMTLEPGDVLLTGTPAGVGPLVAGDELAFEVAEIGRVAVPVRAAPAEPGR